MKITKNSVVTFHYTLNDPDGKLLDTSAGRDAFAYIQGQNMIVPGLERQMEGKKAGEKLMAVVPAKDGYGDIDPTLVHKVPADRFGDQTIAGHAFPQERRWRNGRSQDPHRDGVCALDRKTIA